MTPIRISLAQFDVHIGDVDVNLASALEAIKEAAKRGSQLVLLPELFATGYDLVNWSDYATPLDDGIFQEMSCMARDHHIWVGGTSLETASQRAYNCFALFDDKGALKSWYRKVHLFRLMNEDRWLAPGDQGVVVKTPWANIGLAICYDLRFPELFRRYALDEAQLILICAAWPTARIAHWKTLLRARAIENQLFVAAVNRTGESLMEEYGGQSAVIDPWGDTVGEAADKPSLVTCELDLAQVNTVRQKIPVLFDRRPDVYG
ncbi:MAG TPA: carbon-nitrogen family hydrolase [Anaerolineaceae bacterium]|nr:carbon-nitrogen family hydrolase [Anaerolineaceae bacterium]